MEYVDEILGLYRTARGPTRQYLLSRLGTVRIGEGSRAAVDLLWAEACGEEAPIRMQARRELGRMLPGFVRFDHGLATPGAGVWTALAKGSAPRSGPLAVPGAGDGASAKAPRLLSESQLVALIRTGLSLLDRFVPELVTLGAGPHPGVRQSASLVLGAIRSATAAQAARVLLARPAADFSTLAALTETAEAGCEEHVLALLSRHGGTHPWLALALTPLSAGQALPLWPALENATDATGRSFLAQALAQVAPGPRHEHLGRVIARREPWPTVFALEALSVAAHPPDLAIATTVWRQETAEFLKVQAVRAAGHVANPEAAAWLAELLSDRSPRVQAAALEGLARQERDLGRLAELARPLLASPFLRARINAALMVVHREPDLVRPIVRDLLQGEPIARLEAVYLLGFLDGNESARLLVEVASTDPSAPVRRQAAASLARMAHAHALLPLTALVTAADPAVARTAVAALALVPAGLAPSAQAGLERALPAAAPALKAALLRALGRLAAATSSTANPRLPDPIRAALGDSDATIAAGALDGAAALPDTLTPDLLAIALAHASPAVRVRAIVSRFLSGDVEGLAELDPLLGSPDPEVQRAAVGGLLDLAHLLPAVPESSRFRNLTAQLTARLPAESPAGETLQAFLQLEPALRRESSTMLAVDRDAQAAAARTVCQELPTRFRAPPAEVQKRAPAELSRSELERWTFLAGLPGMPGPRVLWPLVAVGLVALAMLAYLREEAPAAAAGAVLVPAPRELVVIAAEGPVTGTAGGGVERPLARGARLRAGDALATGTRGRAILEGPVRLGVWLGPGSQLQIVAWPERTPERAPEPPVLALRAGELEIDAAGHAALDLELPCGKVKGTRLSARIRVAAHAVGITVNSGLLTREAPGIPPQRIGTGGRLELPIAR